MKEKTGERRFVRYSRFTNNLDDDIFKWSRKIILCDVERDIVKKKRKKKKELVKYAIIFRYVFLLLIDKKKMYYILVREGDTRKIIILKI